MPGDHLLVIDDSPTVLKVVEVALTKAGFRVGTATDAAAGLSLARDPARRPHLILVDSAMPVQDGFEVCTSLARDPELARIPVVVMATRGESQEATDRFARVPNVVDYITKPFSPEAVLAVVSHILGRNPDRTGEIAESALRDAAAAGPPTAEIRAAVVEALAQSGPDSGPLRTAYATLRAALAQRLEAHRQQAGKWEIADIVQGALDDGTLAQLLSDPALSATESGARAGGDLVLSGDLGAISVTEILSLLAEQTQTGRLRATRRDARVDIFYRSGAIDFAAAAGVPEELLLGRFAVEAGNISPATLSAILDERARSTARPPLFGEDLMRRGLLTEAQLKQAMTRQTCELCYEVIRWGEGAFEFRRAAELPDLARSAALSIPVRVLLLDGFRRVDEWRVIEREIDSFDAIFIRDEEKIAEVARGKLTRDEIAILEAVNGKSSVRDIIRTLRMGSFDVSKILFRLLRAKLIRRRVAPALA